MKVGILTFHRTTNYGAALQAYALQETLRSLGMDASIIDYRNRDIYSYYDYRIFSDCRHIKTIIGKILRYSYNKKVSRHFERFRDTRMNLSPNCDTFEKLKQEETRYDAIICGSDQIWNPNAIYMDFEAFLLGTVQCKKIAYAASAGSVSLWEKYLKTYWELLRRFDAISVREADMVHPATELSRQDVALVCDPTLLLNQADWIGIENRENSKSFPTGYILVYFLGKNKNVVRNALALHERTGLPIVSLGRNIKGSYRPAVGPEGFLSLFHHATYVLTSSFHGTIFAMQYRKPFLVFGNGMYNSRMRTLLEHFSLQCRMVPDSATVERTLPLLYESIDWGKIRMCQETIKTRSIDFIKKALS